MNRRLYFLIPDRQHALAVVDELVTQGISRNHMYALGDQRTRLDGLPNATLRQRNDSTGRIEKVLWNSNLVCFGVAVIALIILPIFTGASWWLLLPAAVLVANFLAGLSFSNVPNAHLGEFRDALAHGEILLMVDVPESQVAEVETEIHQHHPEATVGDARWVTGAIGL